MASPQLEHGYTRTANELSEAIMQSDFSKRQRNILDLVIRMSYGCHKKSALLRYSDFELVGVYKSDIKKELDYLASVRVIEMELTSGSPYIRIWLNKNYDQWRINLVKGFNAEKWEQLLRLNLDDRNNEVSNSLTEVGETLTEVSKILTQENNGVSKILTEHEQTVSNLLTEQSRTVSKILTGTAEKINNDADSEPPKNRSFKDIDLKDKDQVVVDDQNKTPLSPQLKVQAGFGDVIQAWIDNIYPVISPSISDELKGWIDQDEMPCEVVIAAIKKAASMGHKNQAYINGILRGWAGKGIKSLEAVAADEEAWLAAKARDKPNIRSGTVIHLNPDIKEILYYYRELFSKTFGAAPVINEAKDGEYIQKILESQSKADLKKLISIYLSTQDEFYQKAGYTIPVMFGQLNKLILELQKFKSDFKDIDPAEYPGGPDCKCGGTGILGVWDPDANNGLGAHRGTTCPCQKLKSGFLAMKGG